MGTKQPCVAGQSLQSQGPGLTRSRAHRAFPPAPRELKGAVLLHWGRGPQGPRAVTRGRQGDSVGSRHKPTPPPAQLGQTTRGPLGRGAALAGGGQRVAGARSSGLRLTLPTTVGQLVPCTLPGLELASSLTGRLPGQSGVAMAKSLPGLTVGGVAQGNGRRTQPINAQDSRYCRDTVAAFISIPFLILTFETNFLPKILFKAFPSSLEKENENIRMLGKTQSRCPSLTVGFIDSPLSHG
ncbi:uncharacterized protein LOC125612933 [Marmota marmota marmota]|uniref:uncharacterized protein LOC125612933 n=1 Tax=Marmota marmota marmota TaxID=9994 RepID=UPI0020926E42|nr:uncharacterized protein LOC125612933 [Marmota marmota marmota]